MDDMIALILNRFDQLEESVRAESSRTRDKIKELYEKTSAGATNDALLERDFTACRANCAQTVEGFKAALKKYDEKTASNITRTNEVFKLIFYITAACTLIFEVVTRIHTIGLIECAAR